MPPQTLLVHKHTFPSVCMEVIIYYVFCCRVTTKTTEIPMKECAAYRQVDPSGERSEETSLYALPR